MHLRSTEYPWGVSEAKLPPTTTSWLRHGDEILKSATTIDIAADVSQLDLIVPSLTLPLRTVRLVENGSCPIFPGRIKADTAVIFTRMGPVDFYREGVAVPFHSEVNRIVMTVLPPVLPDLGDRKDTRICWPLPPVTSSEVVYIFDPSWRTSTTQLPGPRRLTRDGGYLDAAIHYAAQSLPNTRFVFVGVESLPIKGLVMRSKYISELRQWYRSLNPRTMMRLRALGYQILGERVRFPDDDTLCWIRRLFLLQLPEDVSVEEVRLRMERAERDDLGGVEAERLARHGTQIRDTIRERCRGTMIYIRDNPIEPIINTFRPVDQWPDERIDALMDEHLVFYSYEEYRQTVDEDEWHLWTMEPVA